LLKNSLLGVEKIMSNIWLEDKDNQAFLYYVCVQLIERTAPEEIPIFEEVYPQFVGIAQEDDVDVGSLKEDAFGFAGESELFLLACLPAATMLIGALLARRSAQRVSEIRNATANELKQVMSDVKLDNAEMSTFQSQAGDQLLSTILQWLNGPDA
jgi:hypothetical protein